MKRNLLIACMLFSCSLLVAQSALDLPRGKWWNRMDVRENLKLTDEQVTRLNDIFLVHMERMIDLKADLEKSEFFLKELLERERINEKEALKQLDRLLQSRNALERSRAEMLIKMRLLLTPDQWNKIRSSIDKKREMIREKRDKMREDGELRRRPPEPMRRPG